MPFITLCNVLLDQSDRPLYCYGPNFLCEFRIPTAQTFGDCKVVRISYIETIVGYLVVYRYREKFQVVSVSSSEIFLCVASNKQTFEDEKIRTTKKMSNFFKQTSERGLNELVINYW